MAPPDSTPASKGPSTAVAAFPRWRAACQGQLPRPRGGRRGLQSGAPGAAAHTVAGGAAAGGHTVAGAAAAAVGAAPAGGHAQGRVEVTLFSFFFCKWVFFCWTLCQDFSFFPKCTPGLFFVCPFTVAIFVGTELCVFCRTTVKSAVTPSHTPSIFLGVPISEFFSSVPSVSKNFLHGDILGGVGSTPSTSIPTQSYV